MEAKQWWATRPKLQHPGSTQPATTPALVARYLRGLPLGRPGLRSGVIDEQWEWSRFTKASYLAAFANLRLQVSTGLLDLGCGDGFLTCFYASMYPQAAVMGIDVDADAVAHASDLAGRLGLEHRRARALALAAEGAAGPRSSTSGRG